MTEQELWETMMDGKAAGTWPYPQAFATLTDNATLKGNIIYKRGTRVRVVMASRLGDVGITDDLKATSGYHYRTTCISGEFAGHKMEPAGMLTDIELIWGHSECKHLYTNMDGICRACGLDCRGVH